MPIPWQLTTTMATFLPMPSYPMWYEPPPFFVSFFTRKGDPDTYPSSSTQVKLYEIRV